MMTSVTLSSSSGTIHGGYSSVTGGETVSNSESDYDGRTTTTTSTTVTTNPNPNPNPAKRCLGNSPSAETCKKRRKQSTPIRISASEIEDTTTIAISCEGKPTLATLTVNRINNSPENESEIRCPVCQQYFDTSDQFQTHLASDHPPIECKKEIIEDLTPNSTPTPQQERSETPLELTVPRSNSDVQWLNELQSKEWKSPAALSNMAATFNPATNPMFMTLPQFVQSDSLQRQPIRIFNPDAYCDLCNKEFCNKYFLKTHKANKHGIYTDTPITTDTVVASVATTCVNIPSFTGNLKPPTTVPSVDIPFIKNETKIPLNPFSETYPNPFSNKFSTKVIKQTVPGAVATFQESDSNENQNSNGFTSSYTITATATTTNSVGDNNDNVKKMSEDHIAADESSSPSVIPPTESTSFKSDLDAVYYEQSKMSPGQQSRELDLSNRLRKIGVMNPKAFCEICCKEYCNKYFLRTHKMKRHGIYIPDDKEKDIKLDTSFGNFSWQHTMQTSPLNLIMGEQSASTERKTTSPNDISCDICGIKFQNASLAQLHNISVHEKLHSKEQQEQYANMCDESANRKSPDENIVEAISADLQKLQSMILQLNDLDASKVNRSCSSCNKEFENRYYLHAHMLTEHGVLLEEPSEMNKQQSESETNSNNNTMCELTSKDGQNQNGDEIKSHLIDFQSARDEQPPPQQQQPNKDDFNENEKVLNRLTSTTASLTTATTTPSAASLNSGQISERRISMNVTPTSSYCDICNKELCNKYFMKTHMQRMHGIEIENGAQIGGVVCDICNKELCSKYFLRVHKHNTHGIIDCPSSLLQPRKSDGEQAPTLPPPPPPPQSLVLSEPDSSLKPDKDDTDNRYFSHYTEVCSICSRRFKSTKWLKAHLLSDHGQSGAEKWAELEAQLQQTQGKSNDSHTIKLERFSPTIKIPNGGGPPADQQLQSRIGIQNVLSSLFGVDETNVKTYQCSYCSFTTTLLPLLFVHERSHSISTNGELPQLKCPACPQTFVQPELLQHHLFTQHPFLPLPPFFNGNNNQLADASKLESNDMQTSSETDEKQSEEGAEQKQVSPKYRKTKTKVRRLEVESACFGGQSLKDVAKRAQLPATYALPQLSATAPQQALAALADDANNVQQTQGQNQEDLAAGATSSGYVMQAFLLEESAPERRVVPAVVFLPVVQKQPAPLTVTFTLTPA